MKKVLISLFVFVLMIQGALASNFNKSIKRFDIPKNSISISFKELNTGKLKSELNSKMPVSPASTQKLLTYFPSLNILGEDYNFSTKLYVTQNKDYYIVLGADPYLTTDELNLLVSKIKIKKWGELKNLYIDDTVLDNKTWGEGWQWDDDLNPYMPKFGAYNLDKNLYTLIVRPTKLSAPAEIFSDIFYPATYINQTETSLDKTDLQFLREYYITPDSITVIGNVSHEVKTLIPVSYLRKYFILRLDEAFRNAKISYYGKYPKAKLPANATLVYEIKHPIAQATKDVLKNSNNMIAETVFKLAGGKYTNNTGTESSAMAMFNNYCQKNKIDYTKIHITDGSGVSKNNLINADFMTDYIISINKIYGTEKLQKMLPTAGEGTLEHRMFYLKDKLWAKTGTLSNISGITGILQTKNGHYYAFAIYETDGNSKETDKKMLEEFIIREAYNKY